jgi:hypothetical protein
VRAATPTRPPSPSSRSVAPAGFLRRMPQGGGGQLVDHGCERVRVPVDPDYAFCLIVITDSGDRDHAGDNSSVRLPLTVFNRLSGPKGLAVWLSHLIRPLRCHAGRLLSSARPCF